MNIKWNCQDKRTYHAWYNARARCQDKTHPAYAAYGGRGLQFDQRWLDFDMFVEDLGLCPVGLTLERKDNTLGYCPDNCLWATYSEQNHNKRLFRNNHTGIKGVARARLGWQAYGRFRGIKFHLGTYRDFFEACCARKSWENKNVARL